MNAMSDCFVIMQRYIQANLNVEQNWCSNLRSKNCCNKFF